MALFADRAEAGRDLAAHLEQWRGSHAVVAGIARGGVVVAASVAAELALSLTAVAVRKLGVPGHEEVALGAIAEGVRVIDGRTVRHAAVDDAELAQIEERERAVLSHRQGLIPDAAPLLHGRTVLLIDDGIATGSTARAAVAGVRAAAAGIVLAIPVAPADWRPDPGSVDEYVCAHPMERLWAVGAYYDDFTQTSDEEVVRLLRGDGR
ncbi:phosphoribosyltransferase family protein [Microbacterium horticulturae]|uniref:Phosphoribosyltransferase family protein n=1 Tax=Microbacterium horticulturae TaxID=3028316 RepID=A0ABY8C2C8_9MICO|nr:phosphoribosyltransferase family protein [Microbacterium sp. KACC 23027]WEG10549.1 phosphoribosyltransferase family protein [Microbacterium sp. KACC 23027]